MFLWVNGQSVSEESASVKLSGCGLLLGSGVFTTVKVSNGIPYFLNKHLKRLKAHSAQIGLKFPKISQESVQEFIQKNNCSEGIWKLNIFCFLQEKESSVVMRLEKYFTSKESIKLVSYPHPIERSVSRLKSISRLDYHLVKQHADANKCDDAVIKTADGIILETSCSNLVWFYHDKVFTPSMTLPKLNGISLEHLLEWVEKSGFSTEFVEVKSIPQDARIYVTNSMIDIIPVSQIDQLVYPVDQNLTKRLRKIYECKTC